MKNEGDPKAMAILLTGGDWASMLRDAEVLSDVCRTILPCLETPLQLELADIAKLCFRDLDEAIRRWGILSGHVRAHILIAQKAPGNLHAKA